ncbi:tripartite tricarboxylate transporter substrate binding protein [Ottowia sp. VDI28]
MLFVNASFPARTIQEFLAYVKANPGKTNVGVVSPLSTLGFEVLKKAGGVDAQTVPYKGSAPAVTALLSGEIHGTYDGPGTYVQLVQSGKVRALMYTSEPRLDTFPDALTPGEAGLPGYRVGYTTALWAPAGTPQPILARLSHAVAQVISMEPVQKVLRENSLQPIAMEPRQLAKVGREEVEFFMQAARAAKVMPE